MEKLGHDFGREPSGTHQFIEDVPPAAPETVYPILDREVFDGDCGPECPCGDPGDCGYC